MRIMTRHIDRMFVCASVMTLMLTGITGCALAGDQTLPTDLQSRLQSSEGTADDHLTAALLYQQHAKQLEADAARYAREADRISPLEDTKGFRRAGLKAAAQSREKQAHDMLQLVAEHQQKADVLTATRAQQ